MPPPLPSGDPTLDLPFAHGGPVLSGHLRSTPDDFIVEEELGYEASGAGEHVFLKVRKRERNTHEVARAIAKLAGVPQVAVGYAGLKDRSAVTTQHFTVQLPGREAPDWSALEGETLQILSAVRHHRKIRRGGLRGNQFVIRIRQVEGDRAQAEQRMRQIAQAGVPNYFGSQRFGRDGQNLVQADDLFAGRGRRPNRELRGLLLSAVRGQLFNIVLQARLLDGCWDRPVDGDVMSLSGSQRQFMFDPDDATLAPRVAQLDVHPTGPLYGRPGRALRPGARAREIEDHALEDWADWMVDLVRFGLDADRRQLRLPAGGLDWRWADDALELRFHLAAGAYATTVLREIVRASDTRYGGALS